MPSLHSKAEKGKFITADLAFSENSKFKKICLINEELLKTLVA